MDSDAITAMSLQHRHTYRQSLSDGPHTDRNQFARMEQIRRGACASQTRDQVIARRSAKAPKQNMAAGVTPPRGGLLDVHGRIR